MIREELREADMSHRPVRRGMRCIWCNKYRPRDGSRCYGFINSDVDECLNDGYSYYRARRA